MRGNTSQTPEPQPGQHLARQRRSGEKKGGRMMRAAKAAGLTPHTNRMPTKLNARNDNKDSDKRQGNPRPIALCYAQVIRADFQGVGLGVAVKTFSEPGTTAVPGVGEGSAVGVSAQLRVAAARAS